MTDREIELLNEQLKPQAYQVVYPLPRLYPPIAFTQRIDIGLMYTVDDRLVVPQADVNEGVLSSTGVLLWLFNRGYTPPIHMGIVPHGATSLSTDNLGSGNPTLTLWNGGGLWVGLRYPTLTYVETPIPRAQQCNTSPDLDNMFSVVRVICGSMSVIGDSAPIGNVPLNGLLTGGSYNDVRNVQQVHHPGKAEAEAWQSYTDTDMTLQSVPKGCTKTNIPIADGIMALVGPDISPVLTPTNPDSHVYTNGTSKLYTGTGYLTTSVPVPNGRSTVLHAAWISPWNVTMSLPTSTPTYPGGIGVQNIHFEHGINPCGSLDIASDIHLQYGTIPNGELEQAVCHVFGKATSNGSIEYTCYRQRLSPTAVYANAIDMAQSGDTLTYMSVVSPRTYSASYASIGMYIGTQIVTLTSAYHGGYTTDGLRAINFKVTASTLYGMGELGFCRAVQYSHVTNGAMIMMKAVVHVEGEPFGRNASFVSDNVVDDQRRTNDSLHGTLETSHMWDHRRSTLIKRVNILSEYTTLIALTGGDSMTSLIHEVTRLKNAQGEDTADENVARGKRMRAATYDINPYSSRMASAKDVGQRLKTLDVGMTAKYTKPEVYRRGST